MSQAPSMPVYTDALIGDTMHLSTEEFGAYCLLLFATWRNNGVPLPDDDKKLARICRVTRQRWIERLRPVLVSFFDISARTWRQKRLEKEWNYVRKTSEKNSAAANARWLKTNKTDDAPASSGHMPNGCPQTHTHKKEEKGTLSGAKKERRSQKRQIPEDWMPSEAGIAYAAERAGWMGQALNDEVEHFRDHHRTNGNAFSDHDAAWRNWVRNGAKFKQRSQGNGSRKRSAVDSLIEGFGRAAGLGRPPDRGPDWSSAGPLLDGEYARFDA